MSIIVRVSRATATSCCDCGRGGKTYHAAGGLVLCVLCILKLVEAGADPRGDEDVIDEIAAEIAKEKRL